MNWLFIKKIVSDVISQAYMITRSDVIVFKFDLWIKLVVFFSFSYENMKNQRLDSRQIHFDRIKKVFQVSLVVWLQLKFQIILMKDMFYNTISRQYIDAYGRIKKHMNY